MENNKRGRDGGRKEGSNPEKRSAKSPHSSDKPFGRKPASTDKPYKKEKSSDYDKKRSSATGRGRPSERSDDKPSGYRREARPDTGDQRYSKPRPASAGRGRPSERSDDKPSGYRREARPDTGDQRYSKPRPASAGRGRPSERSDDKPSGYKRETRPDAGDQRYSKPRPASAGRGRPSERSDDKPSGYRREGRPDAGDQRYSKPRPASAGRGRPPERSDDKPSGYRREARPDAGDQRYSKPRPANDGRGRLSERSDDKPSGYRREARPDTGDQRYSKPRPASAGRGRSSERSDEKPSGYRRERTSYETGKPAARKPRPVKADENAPLRLNKFIANAGVCSRREADKLIESGAVKVNGVIVSELGTRVSPTDKVQLGDQTLTSERLRYVLLNKPKGYITTSEDPLKRNTVMKLVEEACKERIYPVGRLDRNTSGLLLFTNDGELAKRLTHPRYGVRKIYGVELDKPLTKKDMEGIASGVELDGETIIIDEIAYVEFEKNKKHVGIELHSGQNRVVRRIFEQLGYDVVKLDRVMIGSLTKKDLQRGFWRHLTDLEVRMLKRL